MIAIDDITTRGIMASSSSYYSLAWPYNTSYSSFSVSWNDTSDYSADPLTAYRTTTTASTYNATATTTESYSTYDDFGPTETVTTEGYTTESLTAGGRTTATTSINTTASRTAGAASSTISGITSETYTVGISGRPDTTARIYHAEAGLDLLVFTGTGPQPVTAGVRTDSTKITRKVLAASSWTGGLPGSTFTKFTTTGETHLSDTNRGYASGHDYSTVTVTTYYGGQLPPMSDSYTVRSGKTQTTLSSNSGTATGTWDWYQTSAETVSYTDFTTTMHRSGTGTGSHYHTSFTVGITTSSHTTAADWGVVSSSTFSIASAGGSASHPSTVGTHRTFKTTAETVSIFEPFPATGFLDSSYQFGGSPLPINYLHSEVRGWNPVSSEFSDAPVGVGITASAARTLRDFPAWSAGLSVAAPAPYPRATSFAMMTDSANTLAGVATVIFGSDSIVSSTWPVQTTASTDPGTSSGTMSLATAGGPAQTIQTTRNASAWTTIGAVDAVVPAGILVAHHESGEDSSYFSAPTHYQHTFTQAVVLKHLEYIAGPCVLEVPQYISTSDTYGFA